MAKPMYKCIAAVILGFISGTQSANILLLFTIPSLSNHIMYRPIVDLLASRNHSIVLVTTDPDPAQNETWKNVIEIDLRDVSYAVWDKYLIEYSRQVSTSTDRLLFTKIFGRINAEITHAQLSHPAMRDLLNSGQHKFDVAIGSVMFLVNLAIAKKFKVPFLGIHPSDILNGLHYRLGNSFANMYYPDPFHPHARSLLTLDGLQDRYNEYWLHSSVENVASATDKIISEYFKIEEGTLSLLENMDVLLLTTDPNWSVVRPVRTNTVFTGDTRLFVGNPIEKDLEKVLNESAQGVVYLSLGSNIKSSGLPNDRLNVIITALAALPYRVLWKWETAVQPDLPPNVLTAPWFSQESILAHPNVKVFVTHGGLLSIREALYYEVPVVVIPFFGDQHFNAMRVKDLGLGEILDFKTMTSHDLQKTIEHVGTNFSFLENIRSTSDRLFDQPSAAVNSAVWWVEYMIRHKGGSHFQPHRLSMAEYFMIDLILSVLLFLFTGIIFIYFVTKIFIKKCSQRNQRDTSNRFLVEPQKIKYAR